MPWGGIEGALLGIPIFAVEIPLFGSIASILGLFFGAVGSGIIGGIVMNIINYFIAKKMQTLATEQAVDKSNEILKTQHELIMLNQNKTEIIKERVAETMQNRHKEAAQMQRQTIEKILANSQELEERREIIKHYEKSTVDDDLRAVNSELDALLS